MNNFILSRSYFELVVIFLTGILFGLYLNSPKTPTLENEIKSFNKSTIDAAVSESHEQEKQVIYPTVPDTDESEGVVSECTHTNNLNIPKHIAVIMDGNRRFGKKLYNDPLKVKLSFHT